ATSVMIPAGQTVASITIQGIADNIDEPDETVLVAISGATNATPTAPQSVTATITDNLTSISGAVFLDYNADGVIEAGEAGLAGRTVLLDMNGNGVLDNNEPQTTTNANGAYQFNNLAPGSYLVRPVLFPFNQPTNAVNGVTVNPTGNSGTTGANLGLRNDASTFAPPADPTLFTGTFPDEATALVQGYYQALLGHVGDAAGVSFWVNQVHTGVPRQTIVQGFLTSTEYIDRQIIGYYETFLVRDPGPSELMFWENQIRGGENPEQVVVAFLTTPEYTNKFASRQDFVTGLYLPLLGRAADADGVAFWTSQLNNFVIDL